MPTRRRRRRWSLLSTFYFLATLGLMVGGSLWIDHRSDTVVGTVSGKLEEIQYSFVPQGAWYRFHRVGVNFMTADGRSGSATITAPQERYDALRVGDTLSIRYLAAAPIFARSADRSTGSVVGELIARILADQNLMPLLLWIGVGFVMFWLAVRISTVAVFAGGAIWTAATIRRRPVMPGWSRASEPSWSETATTSASRSWAPASSARWEPGDGEAGGGRGASVEP